MKKKFPLCLIVIIILCLTVLASCSERKQLIDITVQFETNGGTSVSAVKNAEIREAPLTEKDGYLIEGWYADNTFSERVIFPFLAGKSCVLYAKWASLEEGDDKTIYELNEEGNAYGVKRFASGSISLVVPDTFDNKPVNAICDNAILQKNQVRTVYLGKHVSAVYDDVFLCSSLVDVLVSAENETYKSVDGVLFDKSGDTLILFPSRKPLAEYEINTDNVKSNAFFNNTSIEKLIIGKNIAHAENINFSGLLGLKSFSVNADNGYYIAENGILYLRNGNVFTLVAYPAAKADAVCVIKENTTVIVNKAFENANVTRIVVNKEMESGICGEMFQEAKRLTTFELATDNAFYTVQDGVLYSDGGKTLCVYPIAKNDEEYSVIAGTETIGEYAFGHVANLKKLNVSKSVKKVNAYAFVSAKALNEVVFENESMLVQLSQSAFVGCNKLKKLTLTTLPPDTMQISGEADDLILSDDTKVIIPSNTAKIYSKTWGSLTFEATGIALSEYTVTFETQGGTSVSIENGGNNYHGIYLEKFPVTEREGYTFLGWYDNQEGTGTAVTAPYIITEHVVLYAAWDLVIDYGNNAKG